VPAYLDGQLSAEGVALLNERLKREVRLRHELVRVLLQEELRGRYDALEQRERQLPNWSP
jgi:hypothetical protein